MELIPYGRQDIGEADIKAVEAVLRSDWLTQGPKVPEFERAVADYCGANHAVAVNSATSALHIACLALGLGESDVLWTSPNTFVASANCARYCGADVDFVDIDPHTYNMSVAALIAKLEYAEKYGRLPKVVVPVHFAGQSCEMMQIKELSEQYGFCILEDAAHAIGGKYRGEPIGSCRYSDITVFSFHPVKIITTGEGGMALTNDPELARRMERLRGHGITREEGLMTEKPHGVWFYQQIELGFNYRMTDIQAVLGLSQLQRLDIFIHQRQKLSQIYRERLRLLQLQLPWQHPDTDSSWHLYVILVDKLDRCQLVEYLMKAKVNCNVHYIPVHTQPYYRKLGFKLGDFPVAEQFYETALTLPLHCRLTLEQQDFIIKRLGNFMVDKKLR